MDDVKWIKIVTDIFDDEKILLIESLPECDSIIVIWVKLLCLAGKKNNCGVFILNDKIPYTDEMFSTIFRRPINTIRLALKTFEEFGMVEIVDSVVTIPNWEKHQSLDKLEIAKEQTRKRVEKHRDRQKSIIQSSENEQCNVTVTLPVTQCNADRVDKDKNKIRVDKSIENGEEIPSPVLSLKLKLKKYGEYLHVKLTDEQYQKLLTDYSESKISEYIKKVDEYCQQNGKSYKDYNLTIRNWLSKDKSEPKKASSFDLDKFENLAFTPKVRAE